MAASRNGNLGAVGELLNAGAQPNLEDEVNIQAMSPDTYNNFYSSCMFYTVYARILKQNPIFIVLAIISTTYHM